MKAVGYKKSLPIDAADALVDFETAKPEPRGRDILRRREGDFRKSGGLQGAQARRTARRRDQDPGLRCRRHVDAVGPDVTLFKPGDEVFYAGSIQRQGTNSEFHLVDERIVGRKPKTLSFAQAAALPLTSITAWELLFDRLGAVPGKSVDPRTLLIVGGAGGVGSILIQLARRLTGLTIVATASRPETVKWCLDLGAHAVIDHAKPMKEQIEKLKVPPVALIASLTGTEQHYNAPRRHHRAAGQVRPDRRSGRNSTSALLKGKAVSLHWESMFTRSSFQTPDMIAPAQPAERRRRPHRQGRAAHHARPDLRHDQRRQSQARPCAAGIRQVARQDRAGGVVVFAGWAKALRRPARPRRRSTGDPARSDGL